MAMTIPKEFRDMWGVDEPRNAREYREKLQFKQEMEEAKRRFVFGAPPMKNKFDIDPHYQEEKEKAYRLQLEMMKRKEAEKHARLRRKLMESPAMQCTVTDGVNLWIAKFGDGWVDHNALPQGGEGMEWPVLADRLRKIHMMEEMDNFVRVRT